MNKKEQIKEMKTLLFETYIEWLDKRAKDKKANLYDMEANKLYNADYRKTFTSDLATDTQKAFKEGYIKGNIDGMLLARKETAKEILNGMLKKMYKLTGCGVPYHVKAFIKEFAEEYGVEVEE